MGEGVRKGDRKLQGQEFKILAEDNEETGRAHDEGKMECTFLHVKFQVLVAHSEEIVIRL